MSYKTNKYMLVLIISMTFLLPDLRAEGNKKDGHNNGLNKTNAQKSATYLNINKISTYFFNNGISDISADGNSGLYYPKGSGKTAVFTSGLLWGAKVDGDPDPRMGGTAYRTGLVPGKVLPDGTADDPTLDKYRIWRVRPDIYPGGPSVDLSSAALAEGIAAADLRAEYEKDWSEWPAEMGAPYFDGNGNGVYDSDPSSGDIPGVPGADQTLWYVTNDLNASQTRFLYGANPLGIEMQATIWAYNRAGALGSMYFRKYKVINVTDRPSLVPTTFRDMYFSMFSDVDDGDAGDDYVGVDTVLSLQYCYNSSPTDAVYAPLPPPAVGFDFFQGPLVAGVAGEDKNKNGVDDAEDYGIFNGEKVGPGLINLPMTAAYYFANGDDNIGDPPQGEIQGSREFYNFIRGRFGVSGQIFTDLYTGLPTTYALNGDPITGIGWLDGDQLPAGDRRQGSASGPFTMAPGDTQEVVVAEIVAGATSGSDNLKAIVTLKNYDKVAQNAYDQFFKLPAAPPAPVVKAEGLDQMVVLDWGSSLADVEKTETNINKTFKFQGYNIYQLPTASSDKSAGVRIATYDIIDGVKTILDATVDPVSGVELLTPAQYGDDFGIQRSITLEKDYIKQKPLVNGTKYYYAVTAYSYSPDPLEVPNNLENPLTIITVVPQEPTPGVVYNDETGNSLEISHVGTADGNVVATVVDPTATLGHDYQVFFTQREEIRDASGNWVASSSIEKKFAPDTLSGSYIDIAGVYGPSGEIELKCTYVYNSVDGNWADGISLTFPEGVTILSAPEFDALNSDAVGAGHIVPQIDGTTVIFGDTSHPYTGNGPFEGSEEFSVLISPATLPINIAWTVYDDGWSGGPVDASGVTTVESVGSLSRTAKYWNLKDVTTGELKLENQGMISGVALYPKRDDYQTTTLGSGANPIIDGMQVGVNGSYVAPIEWNEITLDPGEGSTSKLTVGTTPSTTRYVVSNYTVFSGTINSFAIDNFGFGTYSIDELQQDYELRYTGVWDSTLVISGVDTQKVFFIKEGTGSMATIFSTSGGTAGLATHPLNPNPGTAAPFLIRIPFEVWNKDTHQQVNLMFRDRIQTSTANPFYAWNPYNRMYAVIVNSPYNSTTPLTGTMRDAATWALVFWSSPGSVGDVITLQYNNPIQIGIDTYTFSTKGSFYSEELAKSQTEKINVFPNPYYGVNPQELNKYNRFVTFSHLPAKAKVRIFNLAGVLVRNIDKDDPDQYLRWDLQNNFGLPVASGLYIAYIELPELGKTKILKVAIIQEEQILDRF